MEASLEADLFGTDASILELLAQEAVLAARSRYGSAILIVQDRNICLQGLSAFWTILPRKDGSGTRVDELVETSGELGLVAPCHLSSAKLQTMTQIGCRACR